MDIFEVIKTRKSIRKFTNKPVESEKIEKIMTAAQQAPSWRNGQCWKFIVINDPEKKKELIRCTGTFNGSWLGHEHAIIVACGNPEQSGVRNDKYYYMVDVAIAMENLVLAATALGLGTCWIGAFDEAKMKTLLKIPNTYRIVAITPLGYPAKKDSLMGQIAQRVVKSKNRKPMAEVYSMNNWE